MLYIVLLIIFLIQLLVALGVLMFVIFLAHPEVPLTGDGSLQRPPKDGRNHLFPDSPEGKTSGSGKNASRSSRKPGKSVMVTGPSTLAAFARRS